MRIQYMTATAAVNVLLCVDGLGWEVKIGGERRRRQSRAHNLTEILIKTAE